MPQKISSKSWLLKSWHICRTHLIWKKNWSSSSATSNLASSGTNSRVVFDWEIRISILQSGFWILQLNAKSKNRSPFEFLWSTSSPKLSKFHPPSPCPPPPPPPPIHPNSKAWLLRIQINNLLHCIFNKTLKKANFANQPFIRCSKRTDLPLKIQALKTPWGGIGDWTIKRVVLKRDKEYGHMSFEGEDLTKYRVKHYHKHF